MGLPALCLLLAALPAAVPAAYIPAASSFTENKAARLAAKANHAWDHGKRAGPQFSTDRDIVHYLKLFGADMMLWRCKNALQPYWDWKPLPVVELYCEVIGALKEVTWYKNGERLQTGKASGHYAQVATPHYANDVYFSRWINFRLKVYNATMADSGIYTFQVSSLSGRTEEQMIYLDISEKKPAAKAALEQGTTGRRDQRRGGGKKERTLRKLTRRGRKKRRNKLRARKKLKRYMRKNKKNWDFFSYRKLHHHDIYLEP